MKVKAPIAVSIAVLIGTAGIVAWQNARVSREVEVSLAEVASRRVAVEAGAQRAALRLTTAERELAALQSGGTAAQGRSGAGTSSKAAPVAPQRPWIPERLQNEPAFQALWLANQRAGLAKRYGPFFRSLGLSPAQGEEFRDIAAKREEQIMDIESVMRSQGFAEGDANVTTLRHQAEAEYRSAQQALLGEAGYQQLQDYERTSGIRETIAGLVGGAVVVARDPFTPAQAAQLVEALANTSAHYRQGGPVDGDEIDWDAIDEQARSILTASQFDYFKTAEPLTSVGGRFQSRLYQSFRRAKAADQASSINSAAKPGGD